MLHAEQIMTAPDTDNDCAVTKTLINLDGKRMTRLY